MIWRVLSVVALGLLLVACSRMEPQDYDGTTPRFVLEDYFLGSTRAWGIFQDRGGTIKRQFTVEILGEMRDGELVLTEDFVFRDGERSQRIWRIRRVGEHEYEGRADDVVGTARGQAYGQALNWQYDLNLQVGEKTYKVHFNDWMYLQEDGVLINRAVMSKFGLRLGEVTIFFKKTA